jgi:hypothetical protein
LAVFGVLSAVQALGLVDPLPGRSRNSIHYSFITMQTTTNTQEQFRALIAEVTTQLRDKPLNAALRSWLNEAIGPETPLYQRLKAACEAGVAAGWLCKQQRGNVRFGRVFEPADDLHGFSVDVVEMNEVVGRHHVHPRGEIDLVIPQQGDAHFDGQGAGWTVYGPGSAHRPTVRGGRALVLYLLPGGEIQFSPEGASPQPSA